MLHLFDAPHERARAIAYLKRHLAGMSMLSFVASDTLLDECRNVQLVCGPGSPDAKDFNSGWGFSRKIAADWLASFVVEYLSDDNNLVLLEDICGTRSDRRMADGAPGPAWSYGDAVFWPIHRCFASLEHVNRILDWGMPIRLSLVACCRVPVRLKTFAQNKNIAKANQELSANDMEQIGNSTIHLITDVFDDEGLVVWTKRVMG